MKPPATPPGDAPCLPQPVAGPEVPAQAPPKERDKASRRWFRLVALLLPLAFLASVEIGLRVAGFGAPASFFIRARQGREERFVENPRFGWRFFPPRLARTPQPASVNMPKAPNTVRLFVFGESAALGDPEPSFGWPRQLERLLQARHPEKNIEIINVAMTAINSYVMREIARDCVRLDGDYWLVYAGNNEVIGPYGAGTVFGRQAPSLIALRASLLMSRTRIGQVLAGWFSHSGSREEWGGMEMFLKQQVSRDDARLPTVYSHFAANLADVLEMGRKSGAKAYVASIPVNLTGCAPFGSQHRSGLPTAALTDWENLFLQGRAAEQREDFRTALAGYDRAMKLDSDFAELRFRRGTCESMLGESSAAQTDLHAARDLDTLRFRADEPLNEAIRRVAAAHQAVLVDVEHDLPATPARPGSDDEMFYDHVHLNFEGNYQVAWLFARALEKNLAKTQLLSGELETSAQVASRLAFTGFDRGRVLEEMRLRFQQPPFSIQSNFEKRDDRLRKEILALAIVPAKCKPAYEAAIGLAPGDWMLHANFGRLLDAAGDLPSAAAQWREVVRLMPREPEGWFQLGNLSYTAGAFSDSERYFKEALRRKPDSLEVLNGLGLAQLDQGRFPEAEEIFRRALKHQPGFAAARVNLASAFAREGRLPEAIFEYRRVLKTDEKSVAARIDLARLLVGQGQTEEALGLYAEAVRLKPEDAVAHYDFANALSASGRHAEAIPHYVAAANSRPDFVDAHYNLGVELARAGSFAEAGEHFAKAVQLKPGFAEAHFNYGVALAKQQLYAAAATEFQQTLQIQAAYPGAQALLERALNLEKQRAPGP